MKMYAIKIIQSNPFIKNGSYLFSVSRFGKSTFWTSDQSRAKTWSRRSDVEKFRETYPSISGSVVCIKEPK